MISAPPRRPVGNNTEARFMQWVWDTLQALRLQQSPNSKTSKTTRGFFAIPTSSKGGGGSVNYKKDWDATKQYQVGDIVRKRTGAGSATGFTGIAICVLQPPIGAAPEFPEPADQPVNPGTTYWHIWALGIATYQACRNGQVKQTYIQLVEQ